jgi:hypothetical protein
MSAINDLYRRRQGVSPTACPPERVRCSTCGMLECLCRPRFFAGQILTADDLNRLDAYIRGKHRLHNRQLHGWGVVNGLEVTCNPCGEGVAVGCGYALSPCGDDIVVCEPVTVDICDLIRRCCEAERAGQACNPPTQPTLGECPGGEEEWILAIRYAESPARGVKPLRPAEVCGCGPGQKPRGAPVQCEPTVVCEGFAFEVYRKPPDPEVDAERDDVLNPDSALYQRFRCCFSLLQEMPKIQGALNFDSVQANPAAWYQWTNKARGQLARWLAAHGSTNCELLARFNAIVYAPAGTQANAGAIFLAVVLLLIVYVDALLSCLCSALLPPCPAPSDEVRVPIATLHVAGQPCRVSRVCNWSRHRKIVTSFPTLQYWLSLLPFGAQLRQGLEALCCFDLGALIEPRDNTQGRGPDLVRTSLSSAAAAPGASASAATDANGNSTDETQDPHVQRARAAYQGMNARLNPSVAEPQRLQAGLDVLTRALGRRDETFEFSSLAEGLLRKGGGEGLSRAESANLPQLLMANQLLRPLAAATLGDGPLNTVALLRGLAEGLAAEKDDESTDLRAELETLKAGLKAQSEEIERLKTALAPGAPPETKPDSKPATKPSQGPTKGGKGS